VITGNALLPVATSCAKAIDAAGESAAAALSGGDWYALQVKRHEEHRVVRHLALRAIPTFLPQIESFRRRGRGATRLEPLFPGYLFVQLPALDRHPGSWHAARWTPGVRRILGTEHTPVPMPAGAMDVIQGRVEALGFVRPGARFTTGNRVRIQSGPLAGLEAIFDRPISRAGRVLVLLELLGQVRRAEVDEVSLDAA
jgi:transcriptional antiterminator RfaH